MLPWKSLQVMRSIGIGTCRRYCRAVRLPKPYYPHAWPPLSELVCYSLPKSHSRFKHISNRLWCQTSRTSPSVRASGCGGRSKRHRSATRSWKFSTRCASRQLQKQVAKGNSMMWNYCNFIICWISMIRLLRHLVWRAELDLSEREEGGWWIGSVIAGSWVRTKVGDLLKIKVFVSLLLKYVGIVPFTWRIQRSFISRFLRYQTRSYQYHD